MSSFLVLISLLKLLYSDYVACSGSNDCSCGTIIDLHGNITCTLACFNGDCIGSTLTCRQGSPCNVDCYEDDSCIGVYIDGSLSTHLYVGCDAGDS